MKKISFLITLSVLAAMLLAACGGGGAADGTGTPPAFDTTIVPTTDDLGLTPTVGAGLEETPTLAGGDLDLTPTMEAGGLTETPAVDLTQTATPLAGSDIQNQGRFVLLSDLLAMPVNGQAGSQLGTVSGVVVNYPQASAGTGLDSDSGAMSTTETPEAGQDLETTGTPEATDEAGGVDSGTVTGMTNSPRISYIIVDRAGVTSSTGSDTDTTSTDATATPENDTGGSDVDQAGMGSEVMVPWEAVMTGSDAQTGADSSTTGMQVLTLDIDEQALAEAPAFSSDMDSSVATSGWDEDVLAFWSGQGMPIPATGAGVEETGASTVMRGPLSEMSVSGATGETFGSISDFIVDLQTGQIRYAVLSGASSAMSQVYVVPATHFEWGGTGQAGGLTTMRTSIPGEALTGAPGFASVDEIDLNTLSDVDLYWQDFGK